MSLPFTASGLRAALGQYATGVAIATTLNGEGAPVGLTINSFASVSLDPPLILWSLGLGSALLPNFRDRGHFAINVLSAAQQPLADRFASRQPDKFSGLDWQPGADGVPLLPAALARFECRLEQAVPGGDHLILIGRVLGFDRADGEPLIFFASRYRRLAAADFATATAGNPS